MGGTKHRSFLTKKCEICGHEIVVAALFNKSSKCLDCAVKVGIGDDGPVVEIPRYTTVRPEQMYHVHQGRFECPGCHTMLPCGAYFRGQGGA